MVCFWYIIVNTLHKGDKKDDDDNDNSNNNNNNNLLDLTLKLSNNLHCCHYPNCHRTWHIVTAYVSCMVVDNLQPVGFGNLELILILCFVMSQSVSCDSEM